MNDHPFDRFVSALQDRGLRVRPQGSRKVRAQCPAHRDARPSLSVSFDDGKVLVNCFGGCSTGRILGALGLQMRDLFGGPATPATAPTITAEYDYVDVHGVLVAQKVRYSNKTFRWRRPGQEPGAWVWNAGDEPIGLYRLPDIQDVARVFLTEGEKATDRLWVLGIPATCPPTGANRWDSAWTRQLFEAWCRELVILADNDRPGDHHAERVAAAVTTAATTDEPIGVKVLRLEGLQTGQDVYDWLEGGRTPDELLIVARSAAWWTPDAKERARLERRRELTRARVQRHRDARRQQLDAPARRDVA